MKFPYYLCVLLLVTSCTGEPQDEITSGEVLETPPELAVEPTSHSSYLASGTSLPEYSFVWSHLLERVNDTTLISNQELKEKYGVIGPDFGLMDWNDDGHKDLFYEYYAEAGTGIKNRIDVHEYDPKTKSFEEESYTFMNPSFYVNEGIITSHYYGNGGGWAFKIKVDKGMKDTLEWIFVDIYATNLIDSVIYHYTQKPFTDTLRFIDVEVQLPPEYQYEKMIKP